MSTEESIAKVQQALKSRGIEAIIIPWENVNSAELEEIEGSKKCTIGLKETGKKGHVVYGPKIKFEFVDKKIKDISGIQFFYEQNNSRTNAATGRGYVREIEAKTNSVHPILLECAFAADIKFTVDKSKRHGISLQWDGIPEELKGKKVREILGNEEVVRIRLNYNLKDEDLAPKN